MYFYSLSFLLLCEDERGSDYSGKRKNFCEDTVESSYAEQADFIIMAVKALRPHLSMGNISFLTDVGIILVAE